MKQQAYLIFDKITGLYTSPILQLKKEIMIRMFDKFCNEKELSEPTDFELYYIGEFDPTTGVLELVDKTFIKKGEIK